MFYRLVARGVIEKTDREYQQTVIRLVGKMRLDGDLPWSWIADGTRWMRKAPSFSGVEDALRDAAASYRRQLWTSQAVDVEVWVEKEGLTGTVFDVTNEWDVPLMPCKGFPSLTFLHGAAESMAAAGKPTHVYYLGDYDQAGLDITANVERRLREFAPCAEIEFKRIAVSEEQIEQLGLLTRPPKDRDKAKGLTRCVEVDAIPPTELRRIVREAIASHVDAGELARLRETEKLERESLLSVIGKLQPASESESEWWDPEEDAKFDAAIAGLKADAE